MWLRDSLQQTREINLLRQECVTFLWAVEKLEAAIEQTSKNITTSARILIFLSQWVQNPFGLWNLHSMGFQITYITKRFVGTDATEKQIFFMQECDIIISCRKTERRDWTDEYKHHSIGTNFDIFIACSKFKIALIIHNFQITYLAERFVVKKHSFRVH